MGMYSVQFGAYDSLEDWGLYLNKPVEVTPPAPQTYYVEVPGRNGALDLTESLTGGIAYDDRTMEFRFCSIRPRGEWAALHKTVMNAIHGKSRKIILSDDPGYYYEGRVTVKGWDKSEKDRVEYLTINATVGPFKWEPEAVSYTGMYTASDTSGSVLVGLTGDVVSKQNWNTDIRFGTATIPTVDFSLYLSIVCTYTYYSSAYHNLQFVDGNGNVYNTTLNTSGTTTVMVSTLKNEGLDPSSIYRILMSGGGDGSVAVYTKNAVTLTVEGSSNTSVPVVNCTSGVEAVTLNGNTVELSAGLNYVEDLVLTAGENVLIFTGDFDTATIVVSYQRGWL